VRVHPLVYGVAAVAAAVLLASASGALAQTRGTSDEDREQAFVDALRREDAAAAERYVALSEARARALSEMRRAESQYNNANPQVRGLFVGTLRQARRRYAEASLALLDFFDARDQANVVRYQEEIGKINVLIEERKRTRAELEKMLTPQ
jgi:hypothetical protein